MEAYEKYEKILVPLDGSQLSETVLPEVERLASVLNSQIIIMTIVYSTMSSEVIPPKEIGKAQVYVDKIKEQLSKKGFNVDSHVGASNNISKRILDDVAEYDVDLIMMCTHGHTGTKHLIFGSVAEDIVHHTTVPVLLVRAK
jgi:nucleotide-binding universal stress UspA family protein